MTDRASAEGLREAIRAALNELGVPGDGYPAPVANAVDILRDALRSSESDGRASAEPRPDSEGLDIADLERRFWRAESTWAGKGSGMSGSPAPSAKDREGDSRHEYVGRLDRVCERENCGRPDRDPIHIWPASASGLRESIDAVADALNAWDRGDDPRPDTHLHWMRIVAALRDTGPRPDSGIDVDGLLAELAESPLPGARYAYEVVKRRLSTPRTETSDGLLDAERDALL